MSNLVQKDLHHLPCFHVNRVWAIFIFQSLSDSLLFITLSFYSKGAIITFLNNFMCQCLHVFVVWPSMVICSVSAMQYAADEIQLYMPGSARLKQGHQGPQPRDLHQLGASRRNFSSNYYLILYYRGPHSTSSPGVFKTL